MPYFDLSIPVDSCDILRGDELARVRELIATASRLGYTCVALDYRARLPLRPSDACRLQCAALSGGGAGVPAFVDAVSTRMAAAAPRKLMSKRDAARLNAPPMVRKRKWGGEGGASAAPQSLSTYSGPLVISRITIVIESTADGGRFAAARAATALSSPLLGGWDVIAVEPSDAAGLEAVATAAGGVDIISLDMSAARLPFSLSASLAATVVEGGGALFELRYAPAIRDAGARRFLVSTARALLVATRGRGVFLASGAKMALELRAPRDAAAIADILGLPLQAALTALSTASATVFAHAKRRRNGGVEVMPVVVAKEKDRSVDKH